MSQYTVTQSKLLIFTHYNFATIQDKFSLKCSRIQEIKDADMNVMYLSDILCKFVINTNNASFSGCLVVQA